MLEGTCWRCLVHSPLSSGADFLLFLLSFPSCFSLFFLFFSVSLSFYSFLNLELMTVFIGKLSWINVTDEGWK